MSNISTVDTMQLLLMLLPSLVAGFRQDVVITSVSDEESYNLTDLHVASLHSLTGDTWPGGVATLAATRMALEDIGKRRDLLPGYRIVMTVADSMCEAGRGINGAMKQLMQPPVKMMLAGVSCSLTAQPLASAMLEWNLVSMSASATNVVLSDRKTYPWFFRTTAPDTKMNPARLKMMEVFGWSKFATVHEPEKVFSSITEDVLNGARKNNLTVLTSEILTEEPQLQVSALKAKDARIIYVAAFQPFSLAFICELFKQDHYGPHILINTMYWWDPTWIPTSQGLTTCTVDQLMQVMDYAFYIGPTSANTNDTISTISGETNRHFDAKFLEYFNGTWPYGSDFRNPAYDVTWAMALAFNSTMTKLQSTNPVKRLEDFTYTDSEMRQIIVESLYEDVKFQGLTGFIDFDDSGSAVVDIRIEQQQGGKRTTVGYFSPETHDITWVGGGPIWHNDKIPVDAVTTMLLDLHISRNLYSMMSIWAAIGIIQSIAFFIFNVKYRHNRLIKMSSPRINGLILAGCVLCYSSNWLADVEDSKLSHSTICVSRLCTFILGFSLAFGSLFAKTWRVHVILTAKSLVSVVISDTHLLLIVLGLVTINASILIAWQFYDPYEIVTTYLPELKVMGDTDDIVHLPMIHSCVSKYNAYFSGALYAVQGITMIFGAFLAWETRQVKLQALNDSKLIGICIYNVAVLSILGGIILFVVEDDLDLSYGFSSGLILCGTMLTANIIFVPKIMSLKHKEEVVGTVLQPSVFKQKPTTEQSSLTIDQWTQTPH